MKLGVYELEQLLGRGAMGSVYRARHRKTGSIVAVKVMAPEIATNNDLLQRFQQEHQVALRVQHPHLVRGLDFGVEAGQPYLVMEYIEGKSLDRLIDDLGALPIETALVLIRQVALAVQAAHEAHLIHRDIKPDNVLIVNGGENNSSLWKAKLADLGLVKDLDRKEELTQSGAWIGTLAYMAPEQFGDAKNVDNRCDIYGLAATLYHALTGSSPFPGMGKLTVLSKKLKEDFQHPREIRPEIAPAIDALIVRSMSCDPSKRPESCKAFIEQLGGKKAVPTRPIRALATGKYSPVKEDSSTQTESREVPISSSPPERRIARRYPSALTAICQPIRDSNQQWMGRILNVSRTGIRLQVDRRFEPGTVLDIEVVDAESGDTSTFIARVRWVKETKTHQWNLGCAFGRAITEADLDLFLNDKQSTIVVQSG
jgi:serine/threonine protein kinase